VTELDEISKSIGVLTAQHAESQRQRDAIFKKLDAIENNVQEARGAQNLVLHKLDQHELRLQKVEAIAKDYEGLKNQGKGVLVMVGLLGGTVGAGVAALFSMLIGKTP
jgi:chromosome segregation ATPase